ncbi:MAG: fructosamine kinase family protein [Bacteroidia bacterium]|jgi:protein-ribulosamine 3-kinase
MKPLKPGLSEVITLELEREQILCSNNAISITETAQSSFCRTWKLDLINGKSLFLKEGNVPSDFFAAEARGLRLLAEAGLPCPEVVFYSENILLLDFQETVPESSQSFITAAMQLANMHQTTAEKFGLDFTNYVGSLAQCNDYCPTFNDFYILRRIEPLSKQAFDKGMLSKTDLRGIEALLSRLNELVPHEPPALIHGDLWRGNLLHTSKGAIYIDPSPAFAHRESDLAMTMLFGGFPQVFYDAYAEHFPLIPGWRQRMPVFQLYPLLVHVLLFGASYTAQVRSIVRSFVP